MFNSSLKSCGSLVAVAVFVAASVAPLQAAATPIGYWAQDGGTFTSFNPLSLPAGAFVFGDFTGSLYTSSNSPGGGSPPASKLFSNEVFVTNTAGSSHTLHLVLWDTDYTTPTAPPYPVVTASTNFSGTNVSGTQSGTVSTYINTGNLTGSNPGALSGSTTIASFAFASFPTSGLTFASLTNTGSTFSISQAFDITVSAGGQYATSVSATVSVPEPASLALLGLGLLGIGLSRRRKVS